MKELPKEAALDWRKFSGSERLSHVVNKRKNLSGLGNSRCKDSEKEPYSIYSTNGKEASKAGLELGEGERKCRQRVTSCMAFQAFT